MTTPNNLRAAAYLATRERLDAKRRSGRMRCNPPNRVCGGRCIPPDWDCRLKGEGTDPHLAAVGKGSDPVAGLANVERGLGRIGKGVVKFSFSEIEGGRKAIARGTAKLSPGDLKRKEEIKKNVDLFLGRVLIPATAIVGAGLLHRGLKNFRGYRDGPGRQVDEAARSAIDLVRTNIPGYGQNVRARRAAGIAAVNATTRATTNIETLGPDSLLTNAGQRRSLTELVQTQISGLDVDTKLNSQLSKSLRSIDGNPTNRRLRSQLSYPEWQSKSLEAFWGTKRTADLTPTGVTTDGSIFSVPAANKLFTDSFGFPTRARDTSGYLNTSSLRSDGNYVVQQLSTYLKTTGDTIRVSMREQGLNPKDVTEVTAFIGRTAGNTAAHQLSQRTLIDAVMGADHLTQAKGLYSRTVASYDELFKRVSQDLGQAPSIDVVANRGNRQELRMLNELRQNSFFNDAVEAHSAFLSQRLNLPEPVYGSYTGVVARKAYYQRFVAGSRNNNSVQLNLTSIEALNAGVEVARAKGRPEPTTAVEALRLLNEAYGWNMAEYQRSNALNEIRLVRGSAPRPAVQGPPPPERTGRRRVRSRGQIIADLIAAGYSPEGAANEADRLIALRRQDARVDAYQLVRQDYTRTTDRLGKPCGKSFIPKQQKCRKPTTARYADKPQPEQGEGLASKVGKVALAAGAVAGTALAAKKGRDLYVNRRNIQAYSKFAPKAMNAAITRLSQADVRKGLSKVPEQFRPQAEQLLGKAKAAMAYISADAQGYNLRKVNTKSNFSVWSNDDRSRVMTVGSVGDTLVTFSADRSSTVDLRTENGRGVGVYDMQFNSDLGFQQKKGLDRQSQLGIAKMVKTMNTDVVANMPKNAVLRNIPYGDDGLGAKRRGIYEKAGYKSLPGIRGNAMFATLDNGKVVPISPEYESFYADLIMGDDYDTAVQKFQQRGRRDASEDALPTRISAYLATKTALGLRLDKKCGKSATAASNKCTKPVVQRVAEAVGVGVAAASVAGAAYAFSRRPTRAANASNTTRPQEGPSTMPFPAGKTDKHWFETPNVPGAVEGDRIRKYSSNLEFEPISNATFTKSIRDVAGHTPEGKRVADLIEKRGVTINSRVLENIRSAKGLAPANTQNFETLTKQMDQIPMVEGAFIDPYFPGNNGIPPENEIWVNHRRASKTEFAPSRDGVSRSMDTQLDSRAKSLSTTELNALGNNASKADLKNYIESFTTYKMADKDDRDFIIAIHETGHALDIGFARRNKPPIDNLPEFKRQAGKVVSHYGLGDLESNKDEFFAESFVLYTLKPERFKKSAPLVYDWVDSYVKAMLERA